MKYLLLVLSCILQLIYCAKPHNDLQFRILGGQNVSIEAAPFQCSLQLRKQHFCGCAIIGDKWVLTATHCFNGKSARELEILVGTNDLKSGGKYYQVGRLFKHDDYDKDLHRNDITVIRMPQKFEFSDRVASIEMSTKSAPEGANLEFFGFGVDSIKGTPSQFLQTLEMKAVDTDKCRDDIEDAYILEGHMCAYTGLYTGGCHGDSGGPLVWNGKLIGIANFVKPCGMGKPDVFAYIPHYYHWVKQTIAENDISY